MIKSALALPWPAELVRRRNAPHARVRTLTVRPDCKLVEWSDDGGATWRVARVLEPQVQHSWARFEFEWDAPAGDRTLLTRATDAAGNTQPDEIPFNEKGYLFNQPLPHPIRVA